MTDDLAKVEYGGLVQRLDPQVLTKANPEPVDLLQARADIQRDAPLQQIFRDSVTEQWPEGRLESEVTSALKKLWPSGDPTEAAQYLADEYRQLGEGLHLISTETGKVLIAFKEEDLYQPSMVPRTDGTMATPLPKIRPDLMSALVTWQHERASEKVVLRQLAEKGCQTELLRELGDPRLLVASRAGRKHIVKSLAELAPRSLLEAAGGSSAAFLKLFTLVDQPFSESPVGYTYIRGSAQATSVQSIADLSTTNLRHNRVQALQGAITQGWIREMARQLSDFSGWMAPEEVTLDDLVSLPASFWILPPDLVRPFRSLDSKIIVLVAENARPMGLTGHLGYLYVPEMFQAKDREFFSRWESVARLEFEMWVKEDALRPLNVTGMSHEAHLV